jgi:hypothetical protein
VARHRAFPGAVPFEDVGIEVEGVAQRPEGEPVEAPRPERFEGLGDRLRGEAAGEARDGRGAREPAEAEELPKRDIGLEHRELGEAARPGEDAREERENDVVGRGRVG